MKFNGEEQIKNLSNIDSFNNEILNLDNKESDSKIKIKFSNNKINNNKENNNKIESKDKLNEQNNNNDNNMINDSQNNDNFIKINNSISSKFHKKDSEIISNSSLNNNKITSEISFENSDKCKDFEDEENFNVFISGTLNLNNNKPKEIFNKKEIKSSKNLESIISNIHSDNIISKISKNSGSDNNLLSIESKDKITFFAQNIEKKKNIQIIKTPNISPKSRSRSKYQNNKLNKFNSNFKKKK